MLRPHAEPEDDDRYDPFGLTSWKCPCTSLREVKETIEHIREDELCLGFHGTVTFDFGDGHPRNVNFQATVRRSFSSIRFVSSSYGWKKREVEERSRRRREEDERRRRRREERARERREKEEKAKQRDRK